MTALPDPVAEPTISVERAGALCGLGRSKSYLEARRYVDSDGAVGLPAIAFGRTLKCPTVLVLRKLGLDAPANGARTGDAHAPPNGDSTVARE
jgi:hypothetical protein